MILVFVCVFVEYILLHVSAKRFLDNCGYSSEVCRDWWLHSQVHKFTQSGMFRLHLSVLSVLPHSFSLNLFQLSFHSPYIFLLTSSPLSLPPSFPPAFLFLCQFKGLIFF